MAKKACSFTWHVEIAGLPTDGPEIRGISYYGLNDAGLINFVRDIPESAIKPPPLQALAASVRPDIRVMMPRAQQTRVRLAEIGRDNGCGDDGVATIVGAQIEAPQVLGVQVASESGEVKSLGDHLGGSGVFESAPPNTVVIFMRHLG